MRLLPRIERRNQRGEVAVLVCRIRARDVARIAAVTSAGIDQEARPLARRFTIVVLVVQHARVFVLRNDVRVRQLRLVLFRRKQIGLMDRRIRWRRTAIRGQCCAMAAYADFALRASCSRPRRCVLYARP